MKKLLAFFLLLSLSIFAKAQLMPNAWPKPNANLANTGFSPAPTASGVPKWTWDGNFFPFYGICSVDSKNIVYLACPLGIVALDGTSGIVKWVYPVGSVDISCPTIDKSGRLFFGTGDDFLFALDSQTGDPIWQVQLGAGTGVFIGLGSPALDNNGTLYVENNNGYLYAVDSASGATKWTFQFGFWAQGNSSLDVPAIGPDGTLYVAAGPYIYAITPDGALLWTSEPPFFVGNASSSPSLGPDGTLYVGCNANVIYALDSTNGSVIWSYQTAGWTKAPPAIGPNGLVYVSSDQLYVFDPKTGAVKWTFKGGGPSYSSLAIAADGTVYFASGPASTVSPSIYALDGNTGAIEWAYAVSTDGLGDPVIGPDGSLYISSGLGPGDLLAFPSGIFVSSLAFSPSSVVGGFPSTGTVYLSGPAPSGGLQVALSSDTSGVTVPNFVTVPAGETSVNFNTTTPVVVVPVSATITASGGGVSKSAILSVQPLLVSQLTLSPTSIAGGTSSTGTVTLNGAAPSQGFVVTLTGNNPVITVPGLVTVPAGQTSATFQITSMPVTKTQYTVVTAQVYGASSQLAYLTVNPSQLESLTFNPSTVGGGEDSTGTVALTGPAPAGGLTTYLSSSNSSAGMPQSVTIPAGQSNATFAVHTTEVNTQTVVVIVASLGSLTKATSLTIVPPQIASISFKPSTVAGGTTAIGTVTLTGPANHSGLTVKLSSSLKDVRVPASLVIGSGKSSATFNTTTLAVGALATATITGTTGAVSATATLTLTAPALVSLSVSPTTVKRGMMATGTVKISGPAPTGGMTILLSSATSGVTAPTKVTIAAGRTSATFTIKTAKTAPTGSTTMSASLGATTKTATIKLT